MAEKVELEMCQSDQIEQLDGFVSNYQCKSTVIMNVNLMTMYDVHLCELRLGTWYHCLYIDYYTLLRKL